MKQSRCKMRLCYFLPLLLKILKKVTIVLFVLNYLCENIKVLGEKIMSEAEALIKKLRKENQVYLNRYFSNAPRWLMESFQVVRVPRAVTFVREGEKADTIYMLMKGKVVAVDYRVQEMAYGFITFDPIEVFGAMEILVEMDRYKTTLETTMNSTFLKVPRESFEKWLRNDINVFRMQTCKTCRYLIEEARKERLYVLIQGVERIYLTLYELYKAYGGENTYCMYISRKKFAEMTGLSERTITRTLKDLEEKEYISREGWNILMTYEQYLRIKALIDDKISEIGE